MNKSGYFLIAFLLLISANLILSQTAGDTSKVYYYRGRVVNDEDKPLVFAHVINVRRGYATITDSTGFSSFRPS
ncbi:MAG: hypothetical protein HC831_20710 [Chloroflexia bacterium]|nr:hypothetical protein [Chloroflexia bacterium]